jgi:UDP-N-acetyl-D-glucosamine/UDP-N-acetyl-D-galactosamine dehydrogenase
MAQYVAQQTIKQLIKAGSPVKGAKVIVLGLTFKENCSDLRNSKVADVAHKQFLTQPIETLTSKWKSGGVFVDVKSTYDPNIIRNLGVALCRL